MSTVMKFGVNIDFLRFEYSMVEHAPLIFKFLQPYIFYFEIFIDRIRQRERTVHLFLRLSDTVLQIRHHDMKRDLVEVQH